MTFSAFVFYGSPKFLPAEGAAEGLEPVRPRDHSDVPRELSQDTSKQTTFECLNILCK